MLGLDMKRTQNDEMYWRSVVISHCFFHLRNVFPVAAERSGFEIRQEDSFYLADITASLKELDLRYLYNFLSASLLSGPPHFGHVWQNRIFAYILCYHLCYLLLSALPPLSKVECETLSKTVSAGRLFGSFRTIELMVDEFQTLPVNENISLIPQNRANREELGGGHDEGIHSQRAKLIE